MRLRLPSLVVAALAVGALLTTSPAAAARRRTKRPAAATAPATETAPTTSLVPEAPEPVPEEEPVVVARATVSKRPSAPVKEKKVEEGSGGGWRFERIGVGLGGGGETGRMEGEQWIHTFRLDESFNYERTGATFNVWGMGQLFPRVWVGPALRVMGGYASDRYDFGLLQELGGIGEWAIPAFEKFEVLIGGRANVAVLVPGGDLGREIKRLQDQGAGVWSVPRVGWSAGVGAGLRRQMFERFWLRVDASGQIGSIYLFSTDETVDALRFRKFWSAGLQRLELALSMEVAPLSR